MLLLLNAYDGIHPRLLADSLAGSRLPDLVASNLSSLTPIAARVIGVESGWDVGVTDVGGGAVDVLLLDADVWLSQQALQGVLRHAREQNEKAKVTMRVTSRAETSPRSDIVALFVPASAASLFTDFGDGRLRHGLGSAVDRLGRIRELDALSFDVDDPPMRLTGLADVAALERRIILDRAVAALNAGVRIRDPQLIAIRGELHCGANVEIDLNVIIEGHVTLGEGVVVGAHSIIIDSVVEAGTEIRPYSLLEGAHVGPNSVVGPYGRLRPGTATGADVQIGNFVEIKNSAIGSGSRINHLSFVGDATLGNNVTLGAATVTCNHDRHGAVHTDIGAGAYIGSGSELVAPVIVGEGATIGAGSTITDDVPPGTLALARERQVLVPGWRPRSPNSDNA